MNFFSSWAQRRKLKQQNKKWRKSLKERTRNACEQRWSSSDVIVDYDCIMEIALIMNLPNAYLYPDDQLSDVLFNPYADLSDVEAMLLIERKQGIKFYEGREYVQLKDIFPN